MFLDRVKYSKAEAVQLDHQLRNWSYLHIELANITEEDWLLKMIKYELDNKGRVQIITRLKTRHNKMRDKRERQEILKYAEQSILGKKNKTHGRDKGERH